MNISFDSFKSIFRECYSSEFKEVPESDETIDYTFSKRFTKRTERLIRRQKSFYWCFINRSSKIILSLIIVLILLLCIVFYFYNGTVQGEAKNNEVSLEKGEIVEDHPNTFNFESDYILDDNGNIIGELFSDKKTSVFNSMINSFYNFNKAHLFIELDLPYGDVTDIEYIVDMENGASNENVFIQGDRVSYSYSDGEDLIVRSFNINEFDKDTYPVYLKADEKYIPLRSRIYVDADGKPSFVYRNNVTNCPNAEYCLLPQKLAFQYLSNFNAWEISDSYTVYFGRHCVEISGKKDDEEFYFTVDSATGILMHYEIIKNGTVTEMMKVKECMIDGDAPLEFEEESIVYNKENQLNTEIVG